MEGQISGELKATLYRTRDPEIILITSTLYTGKIGIAGTAPMIRERYCQDCGQVFTAEGEDDRYCKRCLLKQYRALDNLMKNIKEMKN